MVARRSPRQMKEENVEELNKIFGEINKEDQNLLAAGLGGVSEEQEKEALHLQV